MTRPNASKTQSNSASRQTAARRRTRCWVVLLAVWGLSFADGFYRPLLSTPQQAEPEVRFTFTDVWAHARNPFHVSDPDLFWKLIPGYSEGLVTINREGFRSPEFVPEKPAGTYRIVVLGDSVAFGYKVAEPDTFPRKLERLLTQQGSVLGLPAGRSRVEVINAGVIGYTSWQGRRLHESMVRRLAPDLIVALFGYNDHHSAIESDLHKYQRRYLEAIGRALANTGLFQWMLRLRDPVSTVKLRKEPVARVSVDEFQENLLALARMAETDGARCLFLTVPIRPVVPLVENFRAVDYTEGGRRYRVWIRQIDFALRFLGQVRGRDVYDHFIDSRSGLEKFGRDARACAQVRSLAVQYPDFAIFSYLTAACAAAQGDQDSARAALARSGAADIERRQFEAYNARLRQMKVSHNLNVLDLAAAFKARGADRLLSDVVHPTPDGHALIAETLAEGVRELR